MRFFCFLPSAAPLAASPPLAELAGALSGGEPRPWRLSVAEGGHAAVEAPAEWFGVEATVAGAAAAGEAPGTSSVGEMRFFVTETGAGAVAAVEGATAAASEGAAAGTAAGALEEMSIGAIRRFLVGCWAGGASLLAAARAGTAACAVAAAATGASATALGVAASFAATVPSLRAAAAATAAVVGVVVVVAAAVAAAFFVSLT